MSVSSPEQLVEQLVGATETSSKTSNSSWGGFGEYSGGEMMDVGALPDGEGMTMTSAPPMLWSGPDVEQVVGAGVVRLRTTGLASGVNREVEDAVVALADVQTNGAAAGTLVGVAARTEAVIQLEVEAVLRVDAVVADEADRAAVGMCLGLEMSRDADGAEAAAGREMSVAVVAHTEAAAQLLEEAVLRGAVVLMKSTTLLRGHGREWEEAVEDEAYEAVAVAVTAAIPLACSALSRLGTRLYFRRRSAMSERTSRFRASRRELSIPSILDT